MIKHKLSDYSINYLNENYVIVHNIECDYTLGIIDSDTAKTIAEQYEDLFPLSFEPIIPFQTEEAIENNKELTEDKVKEHIYEELGL